MSKVTIVGAGNVGATAAHIIAYAFCGEVYRKCYRHQ